MRFDAMPRDDFRFMHRLHVRWAEVDMQKIVFNAHYLMYFDTAIAGYWQALALPYVQSMLQLGGDLYLKKATVEFNASARMDDRIDVALACGRIGTSSMVFRGAIFRGTQPLVTGELVYVFADPASQTSRPVPQPLRDILVGYEAGESMVRVETGDWRRLGVDAARIRAEVFVDEQNIPADMEWDAADATAVHAVAWNRLGQPLATGRLLKPQAGVARIGRMAVLQPVRGCGVGQSVLHALLEAAAARGDRQVLLHAQRDAENFYRRQGFRARGDAFDEAGIPHIEMFAGLPLQSP